MVAGIFSRMAMAVYRGVTGYVPPGERLHPEFTHHDGDRWYYNAHRRNVCHRYFDERAQRIRIFLNESDMSRFDGCPYPAILGHARKTDEGFRYCAFVFAVRGETTVSDVESWVRGRGFRKVSVLSPSQGYAPAAAHPA